MILRECLSNHFAPFRRKASMAHFVRMKTRFKLAVNVNREPLRPDPTCPYFLARRGHSKHVIIEAPDVAGGRRSG